jgi:phage tail sheath protein FI
MKDLRRSIRLPRPVAATIRPGKYLEELQATLTQRLQWTAFEPGGETLWAKVRATISDHLANEWKTGALLGTKPEQAFFVKCDQTTMTQADLDSGRLICLVGVAPARPAEFVIIRIQLRTADRKG